MIKPIQTSHAEWLIIQTILQQRVPNAEVWAFGSRIPPHTPKRFSDLDVVVVGQQPLSLSLSADINDAFDESDLPWKVDVLDWQTISESFQQVILENYVVIQQG